MFDPSPKPEETRTQRLSRLLKKYKQELSSHRYQAREQERNLEALIKQYEDELDSIMSKCNP